MCYSAECNLNTEFSNSKIPCIVSRLIPNPMSVAGASNCLECVMGSYSDSNGKIEWLGLCGARCTMAQISEQGSWTV